MPLRAATMLTTTCEALVIKGRGGITMKNDESTADVCGSWNVKSMPFARIALDSKNCMRAIAKQGRVLPHLLGTTVASCLGRRDRINRRSAGRLYHPHKRIHDIHWKRRPQDVQVHTLDTLPTILFTRNL